MCRHRNAPSPVWSNWVETQNPNLTGKAAPVFRPDAVEIPIGGVNSCHDRFVSYSLRPHSPLRHFQVAGSARRRQPPITIVAANRLQLLTSHSLKSTSTSSLTYALQTIKSEVQRTSQTIPFPCKDVPLTNINVSRDIVQSLKRSTHK
jgi:hypothetical protein